MALKRKIMFPAEDGTVFRQDVAAHVKPSVRVVASNAAATRCRGCAIRFSAICGTLNDIELRALESIMSHRTLAAGQTLAMEGDRAEHAYNVVSGCIKLYKMMADGRAQVIGFLLPGDLLSPSLSGVHQFSADATADTTLCQFPRDGLMRAFAAHDRLRDRFMTIVDDELSAAREHMLLLGRKTAVERLTSFLMSLAHRAERLGESTNPLDLPIRRCDIADYLGLTIETVSRTFTQLRSDGIIELPRSDRVMFNDFVRLEAIARGL